MTVGQSAPPVEGRLCFLSSSEDPLAQALLREVLALLQDLAVNVTGPAATQDLSLSSTPVDARPDVGIFIFGHDISPTLVFEIGMLVGQRRPVLLIAPSELDLPLALAELPRLTGPLASEALRFQVSTFLRSRIRKRPNSKPSRKAPSAQPTAEANALPTLRNASAWGGLLSHPDLDDELLFALEHAPFKTAPLYPLAQTPVGGSFADAAFWLPEIEPLNPVIVEFKVNPSPSDMWNLAKLLEASDLHIGIVTVSAGQQQPAVSVQGRTAIVTVPRAMLNDLSPNGRLRHAIVEARNRLLHGVGD